MLRKSQRQQRERQQGGQCGLQLGGRRTKKQQGGKRRHGKKHGKRSRRHSKKQRGGDELEEAEGDEEHGDPSANGANGDKGANSANGAKGANTNLNAPAEGGRRKRHTKKHGMKSKGASDWNKKVMVMYHKMKKDNPATKLGDAMRRCSALKKQGKL